MFEIFPMFETKFAEKLKKAGKQEDSRIATDLAVFLTDTSFEINF